MRSEQGGSGASVVVASYNQPRALALVLKGLERQSVRPAEVVIADDGSDERTDAVVRAFEERAGWPVRFVTQPDEGFRKARALNLALRDVERPYVLFLDGDCIPERTWAEVHLRVLSGGASYATGGYVFLSVADCEAIERGEREPDSFLSEDAVARLLSVHRKQALYCYLPFLSRKKPKILGGNWSARLDALRAVNGFDERYNNLGKEDSDIRNRLNQLGVRRRSVWGRAFVFHCDHKLDPRRLIARHRRGLDHRYYDEGADRGYRCELGIEQPEAAERVLGDG